MTWSSARRIRSLPRWRRRGRAATSASAHRTCPSTSTAHSPARCLPSSDLGAQYCIVGHSERRSYHGETDLQVNAKTKILLDNSITPIICVGESLAQREHDLTETYVAYQVAAAFSGLTAEQAMHCVIAYEPLWAIGTGNTATSAQAQEVCASIRATLGKLYDLETAKTISILYGGSMNAGNAAELLAQPDIDGGLIGGASLKPVDFSKIVAATAQGACE